jgi:hypothetical protein
MNTGTKLLQPVQQSPEPRRFCAAGGLTRSPEPPQRGLETLNKSTLDPDRDRAVDEPLDLVGSRGRSRPGSQQVARDGMSTAADLEFFHQALDRLPQTVPARVNRRFLSHMRKEDGRKTLAVLRRALVERQAALEPWIRVLDLSAAMAGGDLFDRMAEIADILGAGACPASDGEAAAAEAKERRSEWQSVEGAIDGLAALFGILQRP